MQLRILQIDLARQKENIEYVKSYFDFAVANGYNAILVYLENAVRTPDTEYFSKEETYSLTEMKEIVSYGVSIGLDVIPAFENLAHLEKFFEYQQFQKYSELNGRLDGGRGFSGCKYGSCGCVSNDELRAVMDKYIADVCSVFQSKYVHMGLDEPFDFADCPTCKKRRENGESKQEIFYKHVMHCHDLITGFGKTMMMWDDFFEYADIVERLPRDIVMCNWNYFYISEEPAGHWTNRIKKDWFRYYDKLGFKYIFCLSAHRASSICNIETFTDYASRYNPFGAMTTAWERTDGFYLGAYPFIALAGKIWSNQINSEKDKIRVYSSLLGNEEIAELILMLNVPSFYSGFNEIDKVIENEYFLRYAYLKKLNYAVKRIRQTLSTINGLQKDVLTDIYSYVYDIFTDLSLQNLGKTWFSAYETGKIDEKYVTEKLKEFYDAYEEIYQIQLKLWNKYRKGIVCYKNSLQNKYDSKKQRIKRLLASVKTVSAKPVLSCELMLHDGYCTVRIEIKVKYKGQAEETVYSGRGKSSLSGFDVGGVYTLRFALEDKQVEYVTFAVYGEGGLFPVNFRYVANNTKYIADKVERLCGNVIDEENILSNDTQFAVMGYNDGVAHFNDLELSKKQSKIKIFFKEL